MLPHGRLAAGLAKDTRARSLGLTHLLGSWEVIEASPYSSLRTREPEEGERVKMVVPDIKNNGPERKTGV